MTKDVLVSISGRHIDIMSEADENTEALETGADTVESSIYFT